MGRLVLVAPLLRGSVRAELARTVTTLAGALTVALACVAGAPGIARAIEPAEKYNAPFQQHAIVCVRLDTPFVALRFPDGRPTGFWLTDDLSFYNGNCVMGTVRLDLHEILPSPRDPLVFHRGGNGYNDAANVKYGHVRLDDLADPLPPPSPSGGGRGEPCRLAGGALYRVSVRGIPRDMHYKRPQDVRSGDNRGASFMHYGDPGADQGDRHDIHYSYLIWSFLNVRGGGMVRALLRPGEPVRPCDVEPLTMNSWDAHGEVNGTVTARYVRVGATVPVHGWMVWEHTYRPGDGRKVDHVVPVQPLAAPFSAARARGAIPVPSR